MAFGSNNHTLPRLNLSKLRLADLNKLKKSLDAYLVRKTEYLRERGRLRTLRDGAYSERRALEEWCQDIDREQRSVKAELLSAIKHHEVGFFVSLLKPDCVVFDHPTDGPLKVKRSDHVQSLIASYNRAVAEERQRAPELASKRREIDKLTERISSYKEPIMPRSERRFEIGGALVPVDLDFLDMEELKRLIGKYREKNDERREASNDAKLKQIALLKSCPYCGGSLTTDNAVFDFINPTDGWWLQENRVFICSPCSRLKGKDTLRAYIRAHGLDESAISKRLKRLGKEF
jgi:hypothetical protein